ncbi:hypothetical protein F5J12DRAFT_904143 [Pisolithus orientalis]|uniref:uncharacterized protein n=1 Tax=Pisolithus orientalis TaxID=936130 RepID=UPI00222445A9|nr:uncharacterized protein F5J12DRAFT_904143 [Pisolithus orientalis]KAI6019730.1 hypothetical protein F5J12DRAFT_904143 [Pisolithus orientalis]
MKTCRFNADGTSCIVTGSTQKLTRKTVVVSGSYAIGCCSYSEVDEELDYVCRMAKQWIAKWRNPFATVSWIHLVFVRCHPFERAAYYDAINRAYEGDHGTMVDCILEGMQETLALVEDL